MPIPIVTETAGSAFLAKLKRDYKGNKAAFLHLLDELETEQPFLIPELRKIMKTDPRAFTGGISMYLLIRDQVAARDLERKLRRRLK